MINPLANYLQQIEKALAKGNATEHTHRPALKSLIESFIKGITATNEPKRVQCGAPDFIVTRGEVPLGYLEAKDVAKNLDKLGDKDQEQLDRYLESLSNLVLTNYLEFRWFVNGKLRMAAKLANVGIDKKLKPNPDGATEVEELFSAFLTTQTEMVASPQELAKRMAAIARLIRVTIERALKDESKDESDESENTLHEQLASFRQALLPNLQEDQFADLYAQTIAYGLFTARCHHAKSNFTRREAAHYLPKTNPFLRETFDRIAGINLDSRITWAVDDLAELLNRANMSEILRDFGKRTRQEDPVVHFYETFLTAYDPQLRETRGVYYTPEPVVSYIVRSVDKILQEDFGLPKGLADSSKVKTKSPDGKTETESHKVLILDPATGTGTFLYSVIKHIFARFEKNRGMWDDYVAEHLLPRIFGFELLVAPYAVAHLKLGLLLEETGYKFGSKERLRVFLTNTLEEAMQLQEVNSSAFTRWITDEAASAKEIKQEKPVMVVLGNPPYSGHSANKGRWIETLLHGADLFSQKKTVSYFEVDGQPLGEKNPKWLNDDYVKFIRFAQWRIEQTGYGVLAYITNHGYLDNPTFRGMRQALLKTFDEIYLLDLHGNSKKKEKAPDGSKDENVFDIQQGVSIGIFVKKKEPKTKDAQVFHAHLYGLREIYDTNVHGERELAGGKYHWLWRNDVRSTQWSEVKPQAPHYLFVPQNTELSTEFAECVKITEILVENNMGITTGDDDEFVKFEKNDFDLDKKSRTYIKAVAYRPFDERFLFYKAELLARARNEFMQSLDGKENLALCVLRRPRNEIVGNFYVTNKMTDKCVISTLDNAQIFPLYLYPTEKRGLFDNVGDGRRPNLAPEFIAELAQRLKLQFVNDGKGDLKKTFGPEDVFAYAYAVFHAPTYRSRYAEFLKIDFPRLPLTANLKLFRALVALGAELVGLHLLENNIPSDVSFPEKGSNEIELVKYENDKVWINKEQYFANVPAHVWEFHIGGYQVCQKWLKDRKGRKLSFDDLEHYESIVAALTRTIELMNGIDAIINEQGGWPLR